MTRDRRFHIPISSASIPPKILECFWLFPSTKRDPSSTSTESRSPEKHITIHWIKRQTLIQAGKHSRSAMLWVKRYQTKERTVEGHSCQDCCLYLSPLLMAAVYNTGSKASSYYTASFRKTLIHYLKIRKACFKEYKGHHSPRVASTTPNSSMAPPG